MKFVALSPSAIGNDQTPIRPRNPDLPPLLVNPWQVVWIAPHSSEQGGGCTVITTDRSALVMRESMEQVVRILTGDMH